ncbi:MAG: DNA repair protein RadC [Armatimonadetes bacterium]|nr:DNA repair protein RadC [Armatimonadota bacterium]
MAESPLQKLRDLGVQSLSSVELLSLAFANGEQDADAALTVARRLLRAAGGIRSLLSAPPELLASEAGLDAEQAARFHALMELGRRSADAGRGERTQISGPEDVMRLFSHLRDERKEHFCAVLLDAKNRVLKSTTVHIGTVSASVVGVREFFREAVREGAASIIAVHNHPSGDPTPSKEDLTVTKALAEAGRVLEIPLLDHVIIGENDFRSLQRMGEIG